MAKFFFFFVLCVRLSAFEPIIVLVGSPGSGKGTFSQYLKEHHGYNHVSIGDFFRKEITRGTPLGLELAEWKKRGEHSPPALKALKRTLISAVITDLVSTRRPLIIDGFVRTEEDALFLYNLLSQLDLLDVTLGISICSDEASCRERLHHRQVCPNCGHVYNTQSAPALRANTCDLCQAPLTQRIDDAPSSIDKRLREYREETGACQTRNIQIYPHLIFSSNIPLSECLKAYSEFAEQVAQFSGT
ncbi:MAG TPA: nucleoside monophosphate kinase, partial [Chlamydiales bacterium]|nr:nucleoside monophosphate kinase [Chlamydiales bacterium]